MSRPLVAAWASAALFAALACQPAAALEAIAGTQLVMHVGPGAHHPSIGDVPAESHVTVHGCSEAKGWCLVRFAGRHGWIEGESLNVVGFSRPPKPVAAVVAPASPEIVVPVAPEAALPPFITADDVVVGMGEQFGFAAIAPGLGAKPFDLKGRPHAGLAFKHRDFKHGTHVRRHGHFRHPHLDRHAFHAGKAGHFDHRRFGSFRGQRGKNFHFGRAHLGKRFHVSRGHPGEGLHFGRTRLGKDFRVGRGHFGKRGHFGPHGKGRKFGHAGAGSFGGLRIKGGWRP